ncbi:MAG: hypothetical protein SGPRY_011479 [Prymnesium sp.]
MCGCGGWWYLRPTSACWFGGGPFFTAWGSSTVSRKRQPTSLNVILVHPLDVGDASGVLIATKGNRCMQVRIAIQVIRMRDALQLWQVVPSWNQDVPDHRVDVAWFFVGEIFIWSNRHNSRWCTYSRDIQVH